MEIGIIGAGAIGTALARNFARNGIDAVIANRRGPATLDALARELGPHITAVTAKEAAQSDIVIVAARVSSPIATQAQPSSACDFWMSWQ